MGRRPLKVGELGSVTFTPVRGGFRARCRTRDAGGNDRRPSAIGETEALALMALKAEVLRMVFGAESLSEDTPLSVLFGLWIEDRDGAIRKQSVRIYKSTISWLDPLIGAIPIGEARQPLRVKRMLKAVEEARGEAALQQARVALNGAFAMAIENGVIEHNPMRSLRRQQKKRKVPKSLTVAQVKVLREAVVRREARIAKWSRESLHVLGWVIEIMLGSGLRINEVLGLRHCDISWERGRLEVTGTLIDDPDDWHLIRQEELKGRGQARIIELPKYALKALAAARLNASTIPARLPHMPAIQGQATGKWVSARNVRRSLRDLRQDEEFVKALVATGLVPDDITPHIIRKTAATLIAKETGDIRDAQHLLGHADPRTTSNDYVGEAYRAVGNAALLDALLGDPTDVGPAEPPRSIGF